MTLTAASNYVLTLKDLRRFEEEVKSLLRKTCKARDAFLERVMILRSG